jgi:hypothetical protein
MMPVLVPLSPSSVVRWRSWRSRRRQLAGWFTDERTWPADRSFDVFSRRFDYQHHSVLIDLCDEPLIDESD